MDLASAISRRCKIGQKLPFRVRPSSARLSPQTPLHPVPAPRPGSTRPAPLKSNFLAAGLWIATLVLHFGCSPSGQGRDPAAGPPKGDLRTTVEHDIAPWDGPAFGLWIPAETLGGEADSWVYLRIWDAPEKSQKKFIFPDNTMKLGAVKYFLDLKSPSGVDWGSQPRQELKGWVRFSKVNGSEPVVGELNFVSEEDTLLKGQFEAQWINKGWPKKAEGCDAAE